MSQLSMFSAEAQEPTIFDLAGLLATRGQVVTKEDSVTNEDSTRLSVVVNSSWRASALVAEIDRVGVSATVSSSDEGTLVVATGWYPQLRPLALSWTAGAVKTMPTGWVPTPHAQRLWVIAAGRQSAAGYELGLDSSAPDTHPMLATALMRAGIAPTLVGTHSSEPLLRISGHRRIVRLLENIGTPPVVRSVDGGSLVADSDWPVR